MDWGGRGETLGRPFPVIARKERSDELLTW